MGNRFEAGVAWRGRLPNPAGARPLVCWL